MPSRKQKSRGAQSPRSTRDHEATGLRKPAELPTKSAMQRQCSHGGEALACSRISQSRLASSAVFSFVGAKPTEKYRPHKMQRIM